MRISDWSSDVCSSDLDRRDGVARGRTDHCGAAWRGTVQNAHRRPRQSLRARLDRAAAQGAPMTDQETPRRQSLGFLALYALAAAGGATAYVPFLTFLLPARRTALPGHAAVHYPGLYPLRSDK